MKLRMKELRCTTAGCTWVKNQAVPVDWIGYCERCVPNPLRWGNTIPTKGILDIRDAA